MSLYLDREYSRFEAGCSDPIASFYDTPKENVKRRQIHITVSQTRGLRLADHAHLPIRNFSEKTYNNKVKTDIELCYISQNKFCNTEQIRAYGPGLH